MFLSKREFITSSFHTSIQRELLLRHSLPESVFWAFTLIKGRIPFSGSLLWPNARPFAPPAFNLIEHNNRRGGGLGNLARPKHVNEENIYRKVGPQSMGRGCEQTYPMFYWYWSSSLRRSSAIINATAIELGTHFGHWAGGAFARNWPKIQ